MLKKIDYKNSLFQAFVGMVCYFLFIRKETKIIGNQPKLIVGDVLADGVQYKAKYFKDSEYFGKYAVPDKYERNWWLLARMLDKIREKFGSAILITKGYEPVTSGVITNSFQMCSSVQIYPKSADYVGLNMLIKVMQSSGEISPTEFILMDSGQIKLSI